MLSRSKDSIRAKVNTSAFATRQVPRLMDRTNTVDDSRRCGVKVQRADGVIFKQPANEMPRVPLIGRHQQFFATREQLSGQGNRKFRVAHYPDVHGMRQEFVRFRDVEHDHRSGLSQPVIEQ